MRKKYFVLMTLLWWCAGEAQLAAQDLTAAKQTEIGGPSSSDSANPKRTDADAQALATAGKRQRPS
jgi:hypothetical protein